jgi:hypothetical protein
MQPTQNTATLAEQPTRRFDGKPETDADRRFYDLRESGYTGTIDQDGYPVASLWPDEDTPAVPGVNVAAHLRDAVAYLDRHGSVQGSYYDLASEVFTPAACMVGAIAIVCYGGPVEAPAQLFDQPGHAQFTQAVDWLDSCINARWGLCAYEFNDTDTRTLTEVGTELLYAASRAELPGCGPVFDWRDTPDGGRLVLTGDVADVREHVTRTGRRWAEAILQLGSARVATVVNPIVYDKVTLSGRQTLAGYVDQRGDEPRFVVMAR